MTNEQCTNPAAHGYMCHFRRLSWTAVIVGAFIGIGLSFLLNLFSIGIGLSVVKATPDGMTILAVGGFIGLIIGAVVAMFVAGYAAGYLGRPYCIKRNLGILYGFTTWCLALILMVLLTSQMGRFVASYSNFIANPYDAVYSPHKAALPVIALPSMQSKEKVDTRSTAATTTATNKLGYNVFYIFVIFFVGAISSCFGGYFGMSHKDDESCK